MASPGLFEKWGVPNSAALMAAFSAVCALTLGAAVLLWIPGTALVGAIAALVLLVALDRRPIFRVSPY